MARSDVGESKRWEEAAKDSACADWTSHAPRLAAMWLYLGIRCPSAVEPHFRRKQLLSRALHCFTCMSLVASMGVGISDYRLAVTEVTAPILFFVPLMWAVFLGVYGYFWKNAAVLFSTMHLVEEHEWPQSEKQMVGCLVGLVLSAGVSWFSAKPHFFVINFFSMAICFSMLHASMCFLFILYNRLQRVKRRLLAATAEDEAAAQLSRLLHLRAVVAKSSEAATPCYLLLIMVSSLSCVFFLVSASTGIMNRLTAVVFAIMFAMLMLVPLVFIARVTDAMRSITQDWMGHSSLALRMAAAGQPLLLWVTATTEELDAYKIASQPISTVLVTRMAYVLLTALLFVLQQTPPT
eukprot:PLAT12887.1.p1 GENE.PLAT12887.1~~PLAT12887.1.p1  ORF type:complete len:351 (+),score=136.70 PLAT12887.1:195-1247(+)